MRTWDVWHDRAVFHFLTDPGLQDAYLAALTPGEISGSAAILAMFAPRDRTIQRTSRPAL